MKNRKKIPKIKISGNFQRAVASSIFKLSFAKHKFSDGKKMLSTCSERRHNMCTYMYSHRIYIFYIYKSKKLSNKI